MQPIWMYLCVFPFPGAFCIPVYIPYNLTGRWMLGKGLCKVWLVMDYLLCTASVFNIVLISYDRFLSVTRAVSTGCTLPHTHQCNWPWSIATSKTCHSLKQCVFYPLHGSLLILFQHRPAQLIFLANIVNANTSR